MKTVIDRANTRGHADYGWLNTWHTFSFADYYNPQRIHFGALPPEWGSIPIPTKIWK